MRNEEIRLTDIRTDGGTQPRAQLDWAVMAEYTDAMRAGATFPPVTVYYDGAAYWLADGYHRLHAAKNVGRETITAEVKQGTRRDAVLYSVGANADHGLRRTNADKRRAVETLLRDSEWVQWSDYVIAERCNVTHQYANKLRHELGLATVASHGADGRTINTANIGSTPRPPTTPTPQHYMPVATWPTMRVETPEPEPEPEPYEPEPVDEYDKDAPLVVAPYRPPALVPTPPTQPPLTMESAAKLIAEGRAMSPHAAGMPFSAALVTLSQTVWTVKDAAIEGWLDTSEANMWESAEYTLNGIIEWARHAQELLAARKRAGLRVVR